MEVLLVVAVVGHRLVRARARVRVQRGRARAALEGRLRGEVARPLVATLA